MQPPGGLLKPNPTVQQHIIFWGWLVRPGQTAEGLLQRIVMAWLLGKDRVVVQVRCPGAAAAVSAHVRCADGFPHVRAAAVAVAAAAAAAAASGTALVCMDA